VQIAVTPQVKVQSTQRHQFYVQGGYKNSRYSTIIWLENSGNYRYSYHEALEIWVKWRCCR